MKIPTVKPNVKKCVHTPEPDGYVAWHEWAAQASKTHRQVRCPVCGLFKIWMPKAMAKEYEAKLQCEAEAASERCKAEMATRKRKSKVPA